MSPLSEGQTAVCVPDLSLCVHLYFILSYRVVRYLPLHTELFFSLSDKQSIQSIPEF